MLTAPLRERQAGQAPVPAVPVAVCVWGAAKQAGPHPGDSRQRMHPTRPGREQSHQLKSPASSLSHTRRHTQPGAPMPPEPDPP